MHLISLSGLPPDEAEKLCLLAEILGWQCRVVGERAAAAPGAWPVAPTESAMGNPAAGHMARVDAGMKPMAEIAPVDALLVESGPPGASPRLAFRLVGKIIHVVADDERITRQLARLGLDRLVAPVPLAALEQLLVLAG